MSKLTQGTHVYFIDPEPTSELGNVVWLRKITTLNAGGSPASQIDDSVLDEREQIFRKGWLQPGQATMGINADPEIPSHVRFHELFESENQDFERIQFALGWSDGDAEPNVDSNGDWDLPTTRTWCLFEGYIADFPFDFTQNSVVSTQISVQRSGAFKWIRKQSS